jgi:SDR family mycofactocin-dependent oxidoreductase
MGRFDGKVALITGAARGQGRAHALEFAREGANLALSDIGGDDSGAVSAELRETRELCEAEGAQVVADSVDVRNYEQVNAHADRAVAELGTVDIAVPNAGIFSFGLAHELSAEAFGDMIDINLKGVWHTCKAVLPHMIERKYGRIVAIGSAASVRGFPNCAHYTAAKHAIVGLVKSMATEQGANGITVNIVCPAGVGTSMIRNQEFYEFASPDNPTEEAVKGALTGMNTIPKAWLEPEEVSKVVLFLASDEAESMTGSVVMVDMGLTAS